MVLESSLLITGQPIGIGLQSGNPNRAVGFKPEWCSWIQIQIRAIGQTTDSNFSNYVEISSQMSLTPDGPVLHTKRYVDTVENWN